jgi:hypothetical protein
MDQAWMEGQMTSCSRRFPETNSIPCRTWGCACPR